MHVAWTWDDYYAALLNRNILSDISIELPIASSSLDEASPLLCIECCNTLMESAASSISIANAAAPLDRAYLQTAKDEYSIEYFLS